MKTFDIHIRVPPQLMTPLLELCSGDPRVTIIHIGQTTNNDPVIQRPEPKIRDITKEKWLAKIAVPVMQTLRAMTRDGTNSTNGVWYKDLGNACEKAKIVGKAHSVTTILTGLHRAGKVKRLSRGYYLPA